MYNSIALFKGSVCHDDTVEYESLTDIELIQKIRQGEERAEKYFYVKYSFLVRKMVSSFYLLGAETDDLFQEAMIGFVNAVKHFNISVNDNFKYFAEVCIRRQLISALRKNKSYQVLNIISMYDLNSDSEYKDSIVEKIAEKDELIPENIMIIKESFKEYQKITDEILSNFEKEVLNEYSLGKSYEEISLCLKKDTKSIDNAIQRIKKKLNKINSLSAR